MGVLIWFAIDMIIAEEGFTWWGRIKRLVREMGYSIILIDLQ